MKRAYAESQYEGACCYRITRCSICAYAETMEVSELMLLFRELDGVDDHPPARRAAHGADAGRRR